jgi:hypothetical protein
MRAKWQIEIIDNNSLLFRKVPFMLISKKRLMPSASNFEDFDLSCDWNKYSSAQQSLNNVAKQHKHNSKEFKKINDYFICSLTVKDIRMPEINQKVIHDPIYNFPEQIGNPNNRAHSLISGEKGEKTDKKTLGKAEKIKIATLLAKMAKWEIFNEADFLKRVG